ncbi:MAG TPA: TerB family tellurite resistance protein [Methylovirgula sp.]|jgi:uncharacterized tellurite resistance protein B-like protein
MFDRLKSFMTDVASAPAAPRDFQPDDYRLAAASLLVHLVHADGIVDAFESQRLRDIIARNFQLDSTQTKQLIASAEESDKEAVDFYHFTKTLTHALDYEGRQKIVEMMWEIAYADGSVQELEENIVARISDLLSVSAHDRLRLRNYVAEKRERETFEGPWSRKFTEQAR